MLTFTSSRIGALIRGLLPVSAGAFAYFYFLAYSAASGYTSANKFDPSRPIDDWATQVLAGLLISAILTLVATFLTWSHDPDFEDRLPLRGLRDSLGFFIWAATTVLALIPALTLLVGIGTPYVALMTLAYAIFALPLLISGVASALDG
ncbi:hypothetical protein LAZ40_11735 [Cereibacter sphaeroides]|uniref:hypothetical protein n=1 Tax=Cereibacter sphaeroides TaxID=1063 RepID=UPI001F25B714|nr:hypothetical protein [Cereibacter sphaeroides]MCE6959690.1 hypothetical protein [Cereibacter sphaeroides]MCE6974449.1 hypothetical protein [Cereibacter sphaeroides]